MMLLSLVYNISGDAMVRSRVSGEEMEKHVYKEFTMDQGYGLQRSLEEMHENPSGFAWFCLLVFLLVVPQSMVEWGSPYSAFFQISSNMLKLLYNFKVKGLNIGMSRFWQYVCLILFPSK